jgi:Trk K+ transport system NAD-binding subunit
LKQPIVGITFNADFDRTILPQMPLIVGNLTEALHRANLATAKSILVLTDDEILNLEVALMTRRENPLSQIVISTTGQHLSEHLTQLLPETQVLCTYAVAAEAFVGAAFGENILHLFRLNERTILVTEYQIEAEDTLHGLLLAEVAYGYEVVPVLHQRPPYTSTLMPSDELRLAVGDRLVVLATIEGLQRIEQGRPNLELKRWQVRLEKLLTPDAAFEGANLLVRIAGCSLAVARELVNNLPQTLPTPLYQHQAQCLVRELKKALVQARLECL